MALAQDTDLLLLDEPTTFLDLNHQIELLDLLTDLNRGGKTIAIVLHDLNLACRYADHVVAMKDGRILAQGAPGAIVDAALVTELFGLACEVVPDPVSGTPLIVPCGRHHAARAGGGGARRRLRPRLTRRGARCFARCRRRPTWRGATPWSWRRRSAPAS